MSRREIIGLKFSRLTVLKQDEGKYFNNLKKYVCKCDCGRLKLVTKGNLLSGNTRSCGCLLKESLKKRREDLSPNLRKTPIKLKCLYCEKIFESKYFVSKYCSKQCLLDNKNFKIRSKLLKVL